MAVKHLLLRRAFITPLVVLALSVRALIVLTTAPLAGCSYNPPSANLCAQAADAPVTNLTDQGDTVVFETPGTIVAHHGFGCGRSDVSGSEDFIKLEQSLDMPRYVTNATVFLNGWRSKYLHSDHHVRGLATLVGNIRLEGTSLKWQAAGVLAENDFDEGYDSCYFYTAIGWNAAAIDLTVAHDDACFTKSDTAGNFFIADNDSATTALSAFPTFIESPEFASGKAVAVLPRGYGFQWGDDDHHLLQIAYNMDSSEPFIENGKQYRKGTGTVTPILPDAASRVDSGFVSWETYAILKDNDGRRDYRFGEIVSGLGGNDVGVVQPPFAILPHEDGGTFGACVGSSATLQTDQIVVENVPYEYALPMLTGWEMAYGCDDEHVTEVGVWIDEMSYERAPGAAVGTLRYTISSILRDKNGSPGHHRTHKVGILGLRPLLAGKSPRRQVADLVPYSAAGADPAAFCRVEEGKRLEVSVKNQGDGPAGASMTTVTFGDIPLTVATPPIAPGESVDVLFKLPASCFAPDCSFRITVDADNEVDESSHEGNNGTSGHCPG